MGLALGVGLIASVVQGVPVAAQVDQSRQPAQGRQEIVSERTETSRTFQNANGSFTQELFSTPVHFQGSDGQWKPIDSDLVAETGEYDWRNTANSWRVHFDDRLSGDFARFDIAGESFSLSLTDAAPVAGETASERSAADQTAAPAPESSPPAGEASERPPPEEGTGSRLVYAEAFPGVSLQYDVRADGVKETLVLEDADAPTEYHFQMTPPTDLPVNAAKLPDGSWAFRMAPSPEPVFLLAAPRAEDSSGITEEQAHASMNVEGTGESFSIELRLDPEWLQSPERQFPVFLDPTITIQPTTEDAKFKANCSTCTLDVVDDKIYVGSSDNNHYRGALKFDISSIEPGVTIGTAELKLWWDNRCISVTGPFCGGVNHQLNVHRMTSAWSGTSTTSQITYDPALLSSYTLDPSIARQWMSWNVTPTVAAWHSGTQANHGLMIKRATESFSSSGPSIPGRRYTLDTTLQPKLEVTYTSDAVELFKPTTLHSDGANLTWSGYAGQAPFQKYEVHRSETPNFTPSASTLLATINDPAVTSYRDTYAAPGGTFTYKVVANTSPSQGWTVTLPPDGQATKLLQPGPEEGKATTFSYWTTLTNCWTYGRDERVRVETYTNAKWRSALAFDLRDIPSDATINDATMSLWHPHSVGVPVTLNAHRLTAAWEEGTGPGSCTGDGATWYETQDGVDWRTQGGDFDPNVEASVANAAGEIASWDDFDLTSLVQRWVSGEVPNLGVLLKLTDESLNDKFFSYYSDDEILASTQRPKLAVTYTDGSHAEGPTVTIASHGENDKVSGTAIQVAASAADDRRVDKVEFLVGGNLVGTDTTDPFETTWNSTSVANGNHVLTAKAYDDAGNTTTSTGVTVAVENSAPPTTSITAPSAGSTLTGTRTFSANASDDVGVTKVEFYVDDLKLTNGEDTTSPYTIQWNTLDPALPFYDGSHVLTTKAYDTHGQVTTSAPRTVTLGNTNSTKYKADITPANVPQSMIFKPTDPQDVYKVNVTLKNRSSSSWSNSSIFLRYRWRAPDDTFTDSANISIGASSLGAGATRTISNISVTPPTLATGVDQAQYTLRFDLFDNAAATQKWFAERGNKPSDTPVTINRALQTTALGFERYYQYEGEALGAGMTQFTNVSSGNSLVRWSPFFAPGRGLSTVVDLTYNSLEDRSDSPVGNNFSLSISSLTRFGLPLDVHPTPADTAAGRTERWIGFTDGDGTTHRFDASVTDPTVYLEPPGVHLYLREYSQSDPSRKWALTRPDRTTFFYNTDGFPTSVEDRNGNRITFTLSDIPATENPSGLRKRISAVTDAGGRSFNLYYYAANECTSTAIRGKVKKITDHNGSSLSFTYYNDGNLMKIVQNGGRNADGSYLPDRSFVFTYVKQDGSGPAIADPQPTNPNPATVQSTRLYSVRDPRGNLTTFTYFGAAAGPDRWKLKSRTNRTGDTTDFAYDSANSTTTVTAPLSRVTRFGYDGTGKVTSIVNPLDQTTQVQWSPDFHVTQVTEPTGKFVEFAYNANGYLTDTWDQLRNHTVLDYENLAVDANDVAGKWKPGRSIPHISQLKKKTDPKGTSTGVPVDDFEWLFDYDPKGNLIKVTDPESFVTNYAYNTDGTLSSSTDANDHVTTFPTYDSNGLPTKVTDAKGQSTRFTYSSDGLLRWVQEPVNSGWQGGNDDDDSDDGEEDEHRTVFFYDSFHRLGVVSTTKSGDEEDDLIWTGVKFDPNDNVLTEIHPHYGEDFTAKGVKTTTAYDNMDRPTLITGPDKSADSLGERTGLTWDQGGRLIKLVLPKGTQTTGVSDDYALISSYDALDRVTMETRHEFDGLGSIIRSQRTHYCYDLAGDLVATVAPRADVGSVNCGALPSRFVTTMGYDDAHRQVRVTDPLGHAARVTYDANGNVETSTNANGDSTTNVYDERDMLSKVIEPFTTTRSLTTKYEYDGVGNLTRLISPRAWDASADKQTFNDFVTSYQYDAVDQLVREDLPTAGGTGQTYVHHSYDANGNLISTSLPVTTSDPAQVPSDKKTKLTYFDTGWIRSMDDPGNPRVHFDYNAEGLQTSRTPQGDPEDDDDDDDELDEVEGVFWRYYADGMLKEVTDQGGHVESFVYDANDNLVQANDAGGVTSDSQSAFDIEATYDTLDQMVKVRQKKINDPDWRFSTYAYDLNGNVTRRSENGEETSAGAVVKEPRVHDLTYDDADWMATQTDRGPTSSPTDDLTITNTFTPQGWERNRVLTRNGVTLQTTAWDFFLNGKLKTLDITTGSGGGLRTLESHTISYDDPQSRYANGNRTADTFTLKGPNAGAPCYSSACTQRYTYDARDRLTRFDDGRGGITDYVLDASGNITQETKGGSTRTFTYTGDRLNTMTKAGATTKFHYDAEGNLDCTTDSAGTSSDCNATDNNGTPSPRVTADYSYDYLNRLTSYRSANAGVTDDTATYTYDALDRIVEQKETHGGSSTPRSTLYAYLGLSNQATEEVHKNQSGATTATKAFTYDAYGTRIAFTNTPQGQSGTTYTYGYDVHGSTSLLINGSGTAHASYGYGPYGEIAAGLTNVDTNGDNPLNPFRYSAKRADSGSATIDMGVRMFEPANARFLQQDLFLGAVADLGLNVDPLTNNRYALAAGNPVSYVEWDGHIPIGDGGGGCVCPGLRKKYDLGPPPEPFDPPTPTRQQAKPRGRDALRTASGALRVIQRVHEGLIGARKGASILGHILRTSDDPALRSFAGRHLPEAGRLTQFLESPLAKAAGRFVSGAGWLVRFLEYQEQGKSAAEAIVRGGLETGGALAGATAGGKVCLAATAATKVGIVSCPFLVIGGAIGGERFAKSVGEGLFDSGPPGCPPWHPCYFESVIGARPQQRLA